MTELFILVKLFRLTEYFLYIMSCSLWHGIPVLQHNHGQSITATSRHRRHMTPDIFKQIKATLSPNKQITNEPKTCVNDTKQKTIIVHFKFNRSVIYDNLLKNKIIVHSLFHYVAFYNKAGHKIKFLMF